MWKADLDSYAAGSPHNSLQGGFAAARLRLTPGAEPKSEDATAVVRSRRHSAPTDRLPGYRGGGPDLSMDDKGRAQRPVFVGFWPSHPTDCKLANGFTYL